jgi:flavodoxin short chain
MKTAVIFWSGTGNTEKMAQSVLEGMKKAGAEADLFTISEVSADMISAYDAIAFGCPAMGTEVLEESEFDPAFTSFEGLLADKTIGLFGSYGWGDGTWMRDWEQRVRDAGADLVSDGVICLNEPDAAAEAECEDLGAKLAA